MTQWILGGIVALALVVGGFLVLGTSNDNVMMEKGEEIETPEHQALEKEMMEKNDVKMKEDTAMEKKDSAMMDSNVGDMNDKGSYEAYAPEKIAKADSGDVVLFFRAAWCPTCRALDADIKANAAKIPAGVTILDVNYDTESALKQKYGVTYQHTLVQVDSKGNQIAKWSGGLTLTDLISKIQ